MPLARSAPGERRRAAFTAARRGPAADNRIPWLQERARSSTCWPARCSTRRSSPPCRRLRELATLLVRDGHDADMLVTRTDSGLDLLVSRIAPPDRAQREAVAAFAVANDIARIAWRRSNETPETLLMRRVPRVWLRGRRSSTSRRARSCRRARRARPRSWSACSRASARQNGWPISTPGAAPSPSRWPGNARVHAVEGAKDLADALGAAARQSGLAGRVTLETRDLSRRPLLPEELADFERSSSIRRATAPPRRRRRSRRAACRSWSACRATPRPSRAMRVPWSMAATGCAGSRRSTSSCGRRISNLSGCSRADASREKKKAGGTTAARPRLCRSLTTWRGRPPS